MAHLVLNEFQIHLQFITNVAMMVYTNCLMKTKTKSSHDGYVPKIMCPTENGYSDYVIMDIDRDGKIANWKADLSDFQE
jgi:hypothetical protein